MNTVKMKTVQDDHAALIYWAIGFGAAVVATIIICTVFHVHFNWN